MTAISTIARNYKALWQEGQLVDFTINVEDHTFKVHKIILASASDYFRAMLTGSLAEKGKDSVELKGGFISASAMEILIKFIYTHKMDITTENSEEVLGGAVYLQISTAIGACAKHIIDNLDGKNCFDMRSAFLKYSLMEKVEEVDAHIKKHRHTFVIRDIHPKDASLEDCLSLLENWDSFEWNLFEYIVVWAEAKNEERGKYLNDFLKEVRYCLMKEEELEIIQTLPVYTDESGDWSDLVRAAVEYHKLPVYQKMLNTTTQNTIRTKETVVCMPGDLFCVDECLITLNGKTWTKKEDFDMPDFIGFINGVVTVNNFLMVGMGDRGRWNRWVVFDPRIGQWNEVKRSPVSKYDWAAVAHNGKLYIIGGCKSDEEDNAEDTVEIYDFESNSWSSTTKLPSPVMQHAACVYGNSIYISGGADSPYGMWLEATYCYDISNKSWEAKAPKWSGQAGHTMSIMTILDKEVICAFDRNFSIEYYTPYTNQWTICDMDFTQGAPLDVEPGIFLTNGNTVYLLGACCNEVQYMNRELCLRFKIPENGTLIEVDYLDKMPLNAKEDDYDTPFCSILSIPKQHLKDSPKDSH